MILTTEKQRLCKLTALIELIEYADAKIQWNEDYFQRVGTALTTRKMIRQHEITKLAKSRLEKYYLKISK